MGKKKRQRDPNESDTSEEDNSAKINGCTCSHVVRAVNLTSVKKVLKTTPELGTCTQCEKNKTKEDAIEPNTVWMCLQCGHQGCGRYSEKKHALTHHETPRSFSHALAVCIENWSVWCYDCDDEVTLECNKKLMECVEFIKKHQSKDVKLNNISDLSSSESHKKIINEIPILVNNLKKDGAVDKCDIKGRAVRGLNNLGNTCFFNSVMQNISQTNCLLNIMESFSKASLETVIDSCDMKVSDKQIHLDPLSITLPEGGAMTKSVEEFLKEMQSTAKTSTVNPSILFGHICRKAPQFRGFRQQDSHELLRHLLDGIRTEEVRRTKTAILNHFNVNGKSSIDNLDEDIKQKIKGYGRSGNQTIVDKVFGGLLISTVVCEECHMSSQVFEPFLDLSLPVSEEKQQRASAQRKSPETDSKTKDDKFTPSKYQEKKLKKQSKKDAKRKAKQEKVSLKTLSLAEGAQNEGSTDSQEAKKSESHSEISDADIEDNTDTSVVADEKGEDSCEGDGFVILNPNANIDNLSSKVQGMRIRRKSQSADSLLVEDVHNMEESFEVIDSAAVEDRDGGISNEADTKEKWKERSLTSLAPRYQCSSHECSIMSCLNQFTAAELLTGSNKFGCENCTKLKAEKSKSADVKIETVYSIANKQLLLFSPPAILTLHLKRFQQVGFTLKKINRHVTFPMMLDIAPFCSSICLGLPTLKTGQSEVLYSLYGIVEHSGRLSGGHYTAYVKVREHDPTYKNFLNTKPAGQYEIDCLVKEMANKCKSSQQLASPNNIDITVSNGKWYHISDSFVREVSSDTVLKAQAYLLFYERIF